MYNYKLSDDDEFSVGLLKCKYFELEENNIMMMIMMMMREDEEITEYNNKKNRTIIIEPPTQFSTSTKVNDDDYHTQDDDNDIEPSKYCSILSSSERKAQGERRMKWNDNNTGGKERRLSERN